MNNIREDEYIDDDFQDIVVSTESETNLVTKINTPINIILIVLNIIVLLAIIVILIVL